MAEYRVTWEVDVEADSPQEAAQRAAALYFKPHIAAGEPGSACVFGVRSPDGEEMRADLCQLREDAYYDDLALKHGFQFVDLGDEWGWRARWWVEGSPHGFPTKAEAWESIKLAYPSVEEGE